MKKLLLILLCVPLIGVGQKVLDFPGYSYSIVYSSCKEVLSKTPQSFGFLIYGDSVIDMKEFDSRLSILLKFTLITNLLIFFYFFIIYIKKI